MLVVTGFVLLTAPATLRYSRAIMLYLFGGIKYNPASGPRPERTRPAAARA
jgi:hypothetical protein